MVCFAYDVGVMNNCIYVLAKAKRSTAIYSQSQSWWIKLDLSLGLSVSPFILAYSWILPEIKTKLGSSTSENGSKFKYFLRDFKKKVP
jgi:hypothetical protein